jgi:hypothetical protein
VKTRQLSRSGNSVVSSSQVRFMYHLILTVQPRSAGT